MPQIIFIEKTTVIHATPARLFRALTESKELSRWLAERVESDPRQGGQICISYNSHEKCGEYRRVIPNVEVAVRWTKFEEAFPEDLTVFRLEKLKPGKGTRVRVVDFSTPEEVEELEKLWGERLKRLKQRYPSKPVTKKPPKKKAVPKRKNAAKAKTTQRKVAKK